ncbi:MAG: leucine-rich repeat domain-containing protein [Planctomycetes bacterium]|nr:leucine-rich repeat domain-containing protein [Planctomycetota bacterium]
MSESLLQDDELRFVDVLLEEVLEEEPAAVAPRTVLTAPRRTPWLTAAIFTLGLGVLVVASWLQRAERVSLQERSPGPELRRFVPKDAAGLADFLRQVTRVRVQPLHSFGLDILREFHSLPGGEAEESSVARLGPLLQGWDACGEVAPKEPLVRVRCFGADGRWLEARYVEPSCLFIGNAAWTPPAGGVRMLRELAEKAQQNLQATYARMDTPEALRALPVTIEFLAVTNISAEVLTRELPRLQALRALHVDLLTDALASMLPRLPALRELECYENRVTEAGWASLARIATLRHLRVFGALDTLTPELLIKVGEQLTSLSLPGDSENGFRVSVHQADAIRRLVKLEELCLAVDFGAAKGWSGGIGASEIDRSPPELLASILALPALRRMEFAARNCEHATLWPEFAKARLSSLRIASGRIDARAIAVFASMAQLRELDLRECMLGVVDSEALHAMTQLQRLDLRQTGGSATSLAGVRKALGKCEVAGDPGVSTITRPPLGRAPMWREHW